MDKYCQDLLKGEQQKVNFILTNNPMFSKLLLFIHNHQDDLLPTGLIGGGLTAGYTKMLHLPLLNIFTDPTIVSLVKDYASILSILLGTAILIYNNFLKKKRKEETHDTEKTYPKETQSESNHDPV
jgi:hypothetical protein